jgi:DNA-binding MarR family transcriptional regulator
MADFAGPPDETIHQITRLKIMAALAALPQPEMLEFTRLRAIVRASDGNLATHLNTLEIAGYIAISKDFNGKKPRTRISITPTGRAALRRHTGYLRAILDGTDIDEPTPDQPASEAPC